MGLLSRADGVLGTDARDKEDTRLLSGCHRLFQEKDLRLQRTEQVVARGGAGGGRVGWVGGCLGLQLALLGHWSPFQVLEGLADETVQLVQK